MPASHRPGSNLFSVLKNRNFLFLWIAQGSSQIAQNMINYLVIVLVERLTGSSTQTGLAILSFLVPGIFFTSVAGVLVDHVNKRTILIVTTLLRIAASAGYFVFFLQERWPVTYLVLIIDVVTFLRNCVNQFFWPAESSAIPLVVEREHFFTVNTLIGTSTNIFRVAGFIVLGPFLLKVLGIKTVLWIIMAQYLVAAAVLWALPRKACAPTNSNGFTLHKGQTLLAQALRAWRTIRLELKDSWAMILRDRLMTVAIVYSSVAFALSLMIGTLAPGFVTRVLGLTAEDAVAVILPTGIGMIVGVVTVGSLAKWIGSQRLVDGSMILIGITLIGLAAVPVLQRVLPQTLEVLNLGNPVILITMVWCFLLGATDSYIFVPTQTLLQDRTPEEAYGRVFANRQLIQNISSIPPILLTGVLGDLVGIPQVMVVVGLLSLFIALFGIRYLRPSKGRGANEESGP